MDTPTPRPTTSRRTLLTTGVTGLAATAFLAACSKDDGPVPGVSGQPPSSTSVPPTVPEKEPTAAELQADLDLLATANSLELLAADVYLRFGSRFTDPELAAAAERFAMDHTAAAEVFAAEVPDHEGVGEPNEFLLTNQVEPVESLLTNDASIADLAADIEMSIAATYITAVGTLLEPEWRRTVMDHGAAAARRAAVLGNGGTGMAPTSALFPMDHLISSDAYLTTLTAEEAAAAEEEAGGGTEGESEGDGGTAGGTGDDAEGETDSGAGTGSGEGGAGGAG